MNAKMDVNEAMNADAATAERVLFEDPGVPMPRPEAPALVSAPTLAKTYGPKQLLADSTRRVVSVARLPSWPDPSGRNHYEWGHGLGPEINAAIGGGVRPGTIIGVGAAAAKAGKTALIHQLADGLALRCADVIKNRSNEPLTPVVVLSEMDAQSLTWRSLSRYTGHPASHFRAGQSAGEWNDYDPTMWAKAAAALESGPLADARKVTRHFKPVLGGVGLATALGEITKALREELGADGREVWPVFMLDPVQRWAGGSGKNATEAMDEFANALNNAAKESGFIVLLTSDATKATATGSNRDQGGASPEEEGAAVFRGSYVLQHILDAALYLRPAKDMPERVDGVRELEVVPVFNRWGASGKPVPFEFDGRTMRLCSTSSAGAKPLVVGAQRK